MTTRMGGAGHDSSTQRALRAACEVARHHGLSCDQPTVLREFSNVLIHLRPAPVVARIPAVTATIRQGDAWLAREVAIASHLAAAGAPVVPPSRELPPGPHHRDGLIVSFWTYVEDRPEPADPHTAGRALRECHDALGDFDFPLPRLGGVIESEAILSRLIDDNALAPSDAAMLRRVATRVNTELERWQPPLRPLHGDAHLLNVLNTTRGPLWADWEDTFLGPLAWDLACLVTSSRVFGTDVERSNAALAGYGSAIDPELLDLCVAARNLCGVVWSIVMERRRPDHHLRERLEGRLRWFRARPATDCD